MQLWGAARCWEDSQTFLAELPLTTHVLMGESVAYPHCAAGDARTAAAGGAVLLGANSTSPF